MINDCCSRCKWKCIFSRVCEDDTLQIYTKFIDFDTKNEQDAYLQSLIECQPIKRKRPRCPADKADAANEKPKSRTFKYTVCTSSGRVQVCKNAFLAIHGISSDRVRRLCNLLSEGKSPKDARGKNTPGNTKPGHVIKCIEDHIASFPTKEAHYTSKTVRYLSASLNVKTMWQLFKEKNPDIAVTYKFYLKVFQENFSLAFGRPQVDTCCQCEELSVKIKSPAINDVAKRVYVADLLVHKRRAKKFFKTMESVRHQCLEDSEVAGISMDFMMNLQLPEIPVQETFYLRQLTMNVFNIHDIKTQHAKIYVYHEGVAKKGPNEVCSFLLDYMNNEINPNVKHLHLFSDGAGGQNKNNTVVRFLLAVVETGRFQTVHHYFPIRGHSFLPCDRDFSVIKRKIKRTDRIYTPKEYVELIAQCTVNLGKFTVQMVESKDIKDFKHWWPKFYKKNVVSTESCARSVPRDQKQHFNVSTFMEFVYSADHIGMVRALPFINGLVDHTFVLKSSSDKPDMPIELAYKEGCVPINTKKLDDVKKLQKFIPPGIANDFYEELFQWPTTETTDIERIT